MHHGQFTSLVTLGVATGLVLAGASAAHAVEPAGSGPRLLSAQQIARQDVTPVTGSEPDTLVEPDVAVSPRNPLVAVAAAHEGRFPDGGAMAISHAWTRDGGRSWKHAPVRHLTRATGGAWDRVSDPVLAFGPDGSAYLSTIALNNGQDDCRSVVLVSRSTDGGATFGRPVTAQATNDCDLFNDKNWITVDDGARSIYRGRIYQSWTYFVGEAARQVLRYSDDRGRTWSRLITVTPGNASTQASQLLVQRDGTVTMLYLDFQGTGRRPEDPREERREQRGAAVTRVLPFVARKAATPPPGVPMRAVRSNDGGRTWSAPQLVTANVGSGPEGIRCCLPAATVDPVTDVLHAAWTGNDISRVWTSSSTDGRSWGKARSADTARRSTDEIVNVDVAAYGGTVLVSFGRRDTTVLAGRYVRQQLALSSNQGRSFRRPLAVGPRSDLRFAAQAGGIFPGDYIGTAAAKGRFYAVWAGSSTPPTPGALYHQVLFGAVVRP